jgi:glutamate racemase
VDRNAPLGVFDSGLGGLTVVRALRKACPSEDIIYLGDTARVPYGTRSAETVVRYARRAAHELTERGVKSLVLACNTVSAVALEILRAELDMPVLGVVEPGAGAAVQAALALGARGEEPLPRIGVLGTAGTIRSGAYPRAVAALSTRLEVLGEPAPLLVPLVEEGWLEGQVPELAVERYIAPLIHGGARVLVLGCTHYPLLEPVFRQVSERLSPRPPVIVDSAKATADVVQAWLSSGKILRATERIGTLTVLVTDQPSGFQRVADLFLGEHSPRVEQIDLGTQEAATPQRLAAATS